MWGRCGLFTSDLATVERSFMSDLFGDRLFESIEKKGSAICVGIDPIFEMLPDKIAGEAAGRDANDSEKAIDAIFAFTTAVLRIVAPHVACVKFQSAYFEKYLWEGVEAYYSLVQEAADLDLLVIGDVKRGDIGSTASAYAAAHLADPSFQDHEDVIVPDAITVSPMLGLDTLEPFIAAAKTFGKGLFVLVRTSNPGSAELQDAKLVDGRTWSEMLADRLATLAAQTGLVGNRGFSSIGAVVGATQEHTISSLRKRHPQSIFLLPGYGTQGATAQMTQAAFTDGKGAIISASRSILDANREAKYAALEWQAAAAPALLALKRDIASIL